MKKDHGTNFTVMRIRIALIGALGISLQLQANDGVADPFAAMIPELEPSALVFAVHESDETAETVHFRNNGRDALYIERIDIAGSPAFRAGNKTNFEIDPGSSWDFPVYFRPPRRGSYRGTLRVVVQRGDSALVRYKQQLRATLGAKIDADNLLYNRLKDAGPDTILYDKEEIKILVRWNEKKATLESAVANAAQLVSDLLVEKEKALNEMRTGMFCSKCHRPASQIEREDHVSFHQHLANVKGTPEPATKEMLTKTARDYDAKIAEAQQRTDEARQKTQDEQRLVNKSIDDLHRRKKIAEANFDHMLASIAQRVAGNRAEMTEKIREAEGAAEQHEVVSISIEGTYK